MWARHELGVLYVSSPCAITSAHVTFPPVVLGYWLCPVPHCPTLLLASNGFVTGEVIPRTKLYLSK